MATEQFSDELTILGTYFQNGIVYRAAYCMGNTCWPVVLLVQGNLKSRSLSGKDKFWLQQKTLSLQ